MQSSQIDGKTSYPPSLQPFIHSHLHQPNQPTYSNNNVVQTTSNELRQLAQTVSQPLVRPPNNPNKGQRIIHNSNHNALNIPQGRIYEQQ